MTNDVVKGGGGSGPMMPKDMDSAIRLATHMASSKLVPKHFHNSPGDCLLIIEQAMRWGMSPFAVAQCASDIHGRLMFEGKLVSAVVENSGAIEGYIDYEFSGEGPMRKVIVSATRKGESKPREVELVLKDVRTKNEQWDKQPDQQLCYAGVRKWARLWLSSVMLGVYTPEEYEDTKTIDSTVIPVDGAEQEVVTLSYPITTPRGTTTYTTGVDWVAAWKRLIQAYVKTEEIDKLKTGVEVNKDNIISVSNFDPQSVSEVQNMLGAAYETENVQ